MTMCLDRIGNDPRTSLSPGVDQRLRTMEVAVLVNGQCANAQMNIVAIHDKELVKANSFRIEIFELCSLCGARFGIGYFGGSRKDLRPAEEIEELPRKLIEILAQDHRHHRDHKGFIELDF
jgi:hypothetical protein